MHGKLKGNLPWEIETMWRTFKSLTDEFDFCNLVWRSKYVNRVWAHKGCQTDGFGWVLNGLGL
jgi:hypothetical protein